MGMRNALDISDPGKKNPHFVTMAGPFFLKKAVTYKKSVNRGK